MRRSSAQVRSLVLGAARELFEERGYDQVSTRDIASRAGVTQALVFRHFGTKIDLFVDAVYLPFSDFVSAYLDRWADGREIDEQTPAADTEAFVDGLFRVLLENRRMLATLTNVAGRESSDVPARASALLAELMDRLQREVVRTVAVRGTPTLDPAYAVRFAFALVYGAAMLGDALFPEAVDDAARSAIADEMAGFVLRGSTLSTD